MESHAKTIDSQEINKFSEQSAHWWDESGPFKPLHQLNPLRIQYIRDALLDHFKHQTTPPLKDMNILDIGCGGGLLCEPLSRLGATVTGLDASPNAIEVATAHATDQDLGITYINAYPEDLETSQKFEAVCAMEIVEHVADLEVFVQIATSHVKPGGLFFFSTLNRTMKSMLLGKIMAEYILRLVPKGTHDWNKFVKPSEMDRLLRANGLEIKSLSGVTLNPLKNQWISTADLSVNYMGWGVKTA